MERIREAGGCCKRAQCGEDAVCAQGGTSTEEIPQGIQRSGDEQLGIVESLGLEKTSRNIK